MRLNRKNKGMLKSKDAQVFAILIVVGTLICFGLITVVLFSMDDDFKEANEREPSIVGASSMVLFEAAFDAENKLFLLDEAANKNAQDTIVTLASKGGFSEPPECKNYFFANLWTCPGFEKGGSFPDHPIEGFNELFLEGFDEALKDYSLTEFITGQFIVDYMDGILYGNADIPLVVAQYDYNDYVKYAAPASEIAGEKVNLNWEPSNAGDSIASLAKANFDSYHKLPYVWGGESPYTYEASILDQQTNPNSIFLGAQMTEYTPPGSSRGITKTVPGFDCSGFVWWILRHHGMVHTRFAVGGFYEYVALKRGMMICDNEKGKKCTKDVIMKDAKPGDIMFINDYGHIGFYLGDWEMVHSTGNSDTNGKIGGLEMGKIESSYDPESGSAPTHAVYRLDYNKAKEIAINNYGSQDDSDSSSTVQHASATSRTTVQEAEDEDVAFDPAIDGSDMSYSVDPGFRVDMDYDFDVYDKLREDSLGLIEAVEQCEMDESKPDHSFDTCFDSVFNQFSNVQQKYHWEAIHLDRFASNDVFSLMGLTVKVMAQSFGSVVNPRMKIFIVKSDDFTYAKYNKNSEGIDLVPLEYVFALYFKDPAVAPGTLSPYIVEGAESETDFGSVSGVESGTGSLEQQSGAEDGQEAEDELSEQDSFHGLRDEREDNPCCSRDGGFYCSCSANYCFCDGDDCECDVYIDYGTDPCYKHDGAGSGYVYSCNTDERDTIDWRIGNPCYVNNNGIISFICVSDSCYKKVNERYYEYSCDDVTDSGQDPRIHDKNYIFSSNAFHKIE